MVTSFMLIYSLECICDALYGDCTTWQLSTRIREHLPLWLKHWGTGSSCSAILAHFVDTDQQFDPQELFRVLLRMHFSHWIGQTVHACQAQVISIRRVTLNLLVQKRFVQAPQLPLPPIFPTSSWVVCNSLLCLHDLVQLLSILLSIIRI